MKSPSKPIQSPLNQNNTPWNSIQSPWNHQISLLVFISITTFPGLGSRQDAPQRGPVLLHGLPGQRMEKRAAERAERERRKGQMLKEDVGPQRSTKNRDLGF